MKEYFNKFKDYFYKFKSKYSDCLENHKYAKIVMKLTKYALIVIISFSIGILVEMNDFNTLSDDYNELLGRYSDLQIAKNQEAQRLEYNNTQWEKENRGLQQKIDEAKPWFDMEEEKQAQIEKEEEAKKLAEEEKAKKLAEEEEKKGYDTGISYKDLARNPADYVGEKIKFEGKVVQVMEGDGEVQVRLAVGGDYDNIIYCVYDSSIVTSRVLEDDYITVMGISSDLITYTSTMGGDITIPSMLVEKIDM